MKLESLLNLLYLLQSTPASPADVAISPFKKKKGGGEGKEATAVKNK